jgi:hypothetical protein
MAVPSEIHAPDPSCWPCGCIAGRRLCASAVRLWKETTSAFERGIAGQDYTEYHVACRAFDTHYSVQEKDLEAHAGDAEVRTRSGPPPGGELQISL